MDPQRSPDPLDDFRLVEAPPEEGHASPVALASPIERRAAFVVGTLLIVATMAGALLVWRRAGPSTDVRPVATPAPAASATPAPLGPAPAAIDIPPLDQSDTVVRQLLAGLSAHPDLAAWLTTDGLLRHVAGAIDNVATGESPSKHAAKVAPAQPFAVDDRGGGRLVVSPRSYQRYDRLADAVASVDPAALAQVYSTVKPRLQEAYQELGAPSGSVDAAVEAAIVRLLETPVPRGEVALWPATVSYRFADERLEALAPSQKQLLRMGPRNIRIVQDRLRAFAHALGIPDERLPRQVPPS